MVTSTLVICVYIFSFYKEGLFVMAKYCMTTEEVIEIVKEDFDNSGKSVDEQNRICKVLAGKTQQIYCSIMYDNTVNW